ncbi:MAG: holo-ACP synthase [Gammaproteobacteria bacterium]|jgi:holo-[acyl-carrier protein] synthase
MIHGIGVDMVEIRRIEEGIARHGARFAGRILNEAELLLYHGTSMPARYLAKRFAAKEAMVKALGTGFRGIAHLREIGVDNDDMGKPILRYSPSLQQRLQEYGISRSHISITDEGGYALAYVLLEAD